MQRSEVLMVSWFPMACCALLLLFGFVLAARRRGPARSGVVVGVRGREPVVFGASFLTRFACVVLLVAVVAVFTVRTSVVRYAVPADQPPLDHPATVAVVKHGSPQDPRNPRAWVQKVV